MSAGVNTLLAHCAEPVPAVNATLFRSTGRQALQRPNRQSSRVHQANTEI